MKKRTKKILTWIMLIAMLLSVFASLAVYAIM